jgi:hypothetical protein
MVAPYCSSISVPDYRWFRHEPLDMDLDPETPFGQASDDLFDAKIALPTALIWRGPQLLSRLVPALWIVIKNDLAGSER